MAKKLEMPSSSDKPLVGILMGSQSDWPVMKEASAILERLGIAHEARVISAHRTPDRLDAYFADADERGLQVIIAGAGGAAHLPGVCAAKTMLPVLGVPMQTKSLGGLDSLLSIVQMPKGIPVGTLAIGSAGAGNAALFAAAILALQHPPIREALAQYRQEQAEAVPTEPQDEPAA